MSLKKHLDQRKFRSEYDDIFGKKEQYKYSETNDEQSKSRKKKRKYGYIPVENITTY